MTKRLPIRQKFILSHFSKVEVIPVYRKAFPVYQKVVLLWILSLRLIKEQWFKVWIVFFKRQLNSIPATPGSPLSGLHLYFYQNRVATLFCRQERVKGEQNTTLTFVPGSWFEPTLVDPYQYSGVDFPEKPAADNCCKTRLSCRIGGTWVRYQSWGLGRKVLNTSGWPTYSQGCCKGCIPDTFLSPV